MEIEEKVCIQTTKEYVQELKDFMKDLYKKREVMASQNRLKRSVLDRVPKNLVEEILLVLDKKSNQPAEVRNFLKFVNSQVVIRVITKAAPVSELPKDEFVGIKTDKE